MNNPQAQGQQLDHREDRLLTITEAAELVRAPVATLRYWRHLGTGPTSFRVGRGVRYWRHDILDWLRRRCDDGAAT